MGIHNFSKVFKPIKIVTLEKMANTKLAIDAFNAIFIASGLQHRAQLINHNNEPTLHIQTVLNNLKKMKVNNINSIWSFDSRLPPDEKKDVMTERKELKDIGREKIKIKKIELAELKELSKNLTIDQLNQIDQNFHKSLLSKEEEIIKLESQTFVHFNKYYRDVIFILEKLGLPYTIAPNKIESEEICALLCEDDGLANCVMTTDVDCLVFCAPAMLKKVPKETGKYSYYELEDCLKQHSLSMNQFIQVCVALGCDYCEKVPRVGAKNVIKKVKDGNISWSEKQLLAIKKFQTPLNIKPIIIDNKDKKNINDLKKWLIEDQDFNADNTDKILSVFL